MQKKSVQIINKLGLHARAAAILVQTSSGYDCDIDLIFNGKKVNGKSIMGIMMLAAAKGSTIEIVTAGHDEEAAMDGLESLISNRFGESE